MTPGIFIKMSLIVGPTSVTVWFALRKLRPTTTTATSCRLAASNMNRQ